MSTIHPDLSIPELIKFIKHSFRESEFDEVQNTLMDREKIMQVKMENLVTDCASLKKQIDLLENTQSFSVLEKCSAEEKLCRTQRRCEELDKETVQMGETIKILRCEKLGIEEKLENSHRKCEEMDQRLVIMAKAIEDMKRDKIDANQAMVELKRKEIEADGLVQELQHKNVEANQTINELRVKKMESDKAAKVYGSSLNYLDPRILKLETNLAKMLSVNVEDLPYLVHGTRNLAAAATIDAEEGGKNLPNFVEGGIDCLDNGKASADANDRVVVSPEVPATSGISGGIGLAKKGSNESAIRLGGEVGAVKAEVSFFPAGNVIMISDSDSDDEVQTEVGDTTFTSSEQTNKRSRTDGGDDGKRKTSTSSSDSEDETDGKRRMFEMIIRSTFRRYERWNPVHPTYGAFWSIGVGISCGIGWGPGFGPEVIGYVGAGCVLGSLFLVSELAFQPTTFYKLLIVVTTRGALNVARAGALLGKRGISSDGWGGISSQISENWMGNMIDFPGMKSALALNAKHITDCFQRVKGRFSPCDGGPNT